jgi:hypothetical protein
MPVHDLAHTPTGSLLLIDKDLAAGGEPIQTLAITGRTTDQNGGAA